ncbi:MAG TPA: alkaline phosphatase D family protein [Candidatus Binatia bacterium]|jgi:PhoD-like phosphatase
MKISLGPILSFRGVKTVGWSLSALIVTDILSTPPELIFQSGNKKGIKRAAKLLKAFPDSNPTFQAWRFDFAVKQTARAQPVSYTIGGVENIFVVPALDATPNLVYASCNGFSSMRLLNDTQDANRLWRQVAEKHEARPYHLLMMGGDQLYCDSMWDQLVPLHEWARLPLDQRIKQPFTDEMRSVVDQFYATVYVERWSQAEPARVFAQVPNIMMWDDHDIFDGWGSYEAELQQCDVYRGIFAIAREYFALYQLQLAREETHPMSIEAQQAFSLGGEIGGGVTLLALDMRSERTKSQVISPESWKAIYDWLDATSPRKKSRDASARHLLLMSSIPVVHPEFALLEKLLGIFPGRQQLEDDLRDQWLSVPHRQERLRLVHRLLAFADAKKCRVTVLSGDVHVGALGIIESSRSTADDPSTQVINQLTSSGIVHPPPAGVVLFFLETVTGKKMELDRDLYSEMVEFPGTHHHFIGARNWLSLEPDEAGRIWANWYVETEPYPYTKVIHPIDFKMPAPSVPSES